MWRCRARIAGRGVELDLPGQLEQQLVGYSVRPKSLYFRRGLIPSWSKPTLVIRDQHILSPAEADPVAAGDYIYLLAPPEKAEALDRFFVDMPPSTAPDPHLLGDFTVSGEVTLGDIAATYGVNVDVEQSALTLADYFDVHLDHAPKEGATLALDSIVLVARSIGGGRVNVVGLRLPEEEEEAAPLTRLASVQAQAVGDVVVGGGDLIVIAGARSNPGRYSVARMSEATSGNEAPIPDFASLIRATLAQGAKPADLPIEQPQPNSSLSSTSRRQRRSELKFRQPCLRRPIG